MADEESSEPTDVSGAAHATGQDCSKLDIENQTNPDLPTPPMEDWGDAEAQKRSLGELGGTLDSDMKNATAVRDALMKSVAPMGDLQEKIKGITSAFGPVDKLGAEVKAATAALDALRKSFPQANDLQEKIKGITSAFGPPDKLVAEVKAATAAPEALMKSLAPMGDLQERMKNISIALGDQSSLKHVAEQISAQQDAINAMRMPDIEPPRMPELPHIPPNPIFETNRRLERIEARFEQMQSIAANGAEIATGLQGAAAEFLQKFERAATDNDRAAGRAIWLGAAAIIIAVAMPAVQIFYSEMRREPGNGPEMQAALEAMQNEMAAMRKEQAAASDRLNETLAASESETSGILRGIHGLLADEKAPRPDAVGGAPSQRSGLSSDGSSEHGVAGTLSK